MLQIRLIKAVFYFQVAAAPGSSKRSKFKFVVKEMEAMYVDEMRSSISLLMTNLDSVPVSRGTAESKYSAMKKFQPKYNRTGGTKDSGSASDMKLSKVDVVLAFSLLVLFTDLPLIVIWMFQEY